MHVCLCVLACVYLFKATHNRIEVSSNLVCAGQEKKYEVRKSRLMKGKSVPHYAAVEPQGKGVMVASEKPFTFTQVDGVPLEDTSPEDMEVDNSGQ